MKEISKSKLLLVEGIDEIYFFEALLEHIGNADTQVLQVGGKDKFKIEFPTLLQSPNFDSVTSYAIVRDADRNIDSAYQSIRNLLEKYAQPIPNGHNQFREEGGRKTGIFIMPGNAKEGMLENLCLDTVINHPVYLCVNTYIDCLNRNLERVESDESYDPNKFYFPRNIHKAKLHAYLAGMEKFIPSLGIATKKGYFDLDSEILNDIKDFLNTL
jgi:hypothetical protein